MGVSEKRVTLLGLPLTRLLLFGGSTKGTPVWGNTHIPKPLKEASVNTKGNHLAHHETHLRLLSLHSLGSRV